MYFFKVSVLFSHKYFIVIRTKWSGKDSNIAIHISILLKYLTMNFANSKHCIDHFAVRIIKQFIYSCDANFYRFADRINNGRRKRFLYANEIPKRNAILIVKQKVAPVAEEFISLRTYGAEKRKRRKNC